MNKQFLHLCYNWRRGEDKAVPGGRGRGILKLMGTGRVESAFKLGAGHEKKGVEEFLKNSKINFHQK